MVPDHFLRLASPQDMLEKAEREFQRFQAQPGLDHAHNLIVTVYHVRDYAKAAGLNLTELDSNRDFELCRLSCNAAKHLTFDQRSAPARAKRAFDTHSDIEFESHEEYAILANGARITVHDLAARPLPWLRMWLAASQ